MDGRNEKMNIEVSDEGVYNLMHQFKMKRINKIERASLMQQIKEAKGFVLNKDLFEFLDLTYPTGQSWMAWNSISVEEYENFKAAGITDRNMRDLIKSKKGLKELRDYKYSKSDFLVRQAITIVRPLVKNREKNMDITLVNELQNYVNRLKMYVEKQ